MKCRHCGAVLQHVFLDLGFAPPSNAYRLVADLSRPELYYPLRLKVCEQCWLVQTDDFASADQLFDSDYAYFSSTSTSWLDHARNYVEEIIPALCLDQDSFVVEVASNDGYLLKNFVGHGIPCLGVEPTASTADYAESIGVPVAREFFGEKFAVEMVEKNGKADLIIGNNVYAHVPDINDFTRGLSVALKSTGTITLEFPHLQNLIEKVQFDTVYHEHFSYLSLHSVSAIFEAAGLRIWNVERMPTHGGSLRVYGCHKDDPRQNRDSVHAVLQAEKEFGLLDIAVYQGFQQRVETVKDRFVAFLIDAKQQGKSVLAYGAAAKGCTLLNFSGVKKDLLPMVADAAPSKQGKFIPGCHIPIVSPQALVDLAPDYLIIFPWNIAAEIIAQNQFLAERGTRFVTFIPEMDIR
ncbi:class I SAM-dependent methyltransferase [Alcanivorax sp. 1008]|uniref:class I SAM-dependent methyltransferase n=1 Tax=Alcanivorax sp. 1008 TaxID=2816853 RepID=UPI001D46FA2D|nr:class I SAM-dependent methyltransferase [Alcanivorax sp. 1008]MCC1495299.1 methyltransferase domain-containing protein [Alcanivorax sp. 1008]